MQIEKGFIYHIYNQGNNRCEIFFTRENYYFFLKKVKKYMLPHADILSWCLMPNHFHFMVMAKVDCSQRLTPATEKKSQPLTARRSFNHSIGIMLRSYTRAINNQERRSGSLFRQDTKAICINCPKGISKIWFVENGISVGRNLHPDFDYPKVCFDYIHENPVKAGLVKNTCDWEFSSAKDYAGLRNGKLINKKLAVEMSLFKG